MERKENKWWGLIFPPGRPKCFLTHQNVFSLKRRKNWVKINFFLDWQKCLCAHMPLFIYFSSPLALGFFFFWAVTCLFAFFFSILFFSFDFLGPECDSFFFLKTWFLFFLINLGDCSFFVVICYFFFLIGYHSLTRVYK